MIDLKTCSGCKYLRTGAGFGGLECVAAFECKHRNEPKPVWSTYTKPPGYRTPEDWQTRTVR